MCIIRDNGLKYSMLRRTNDICENAKSVFNVYCPESEDFIVDAIEREIYRYRQISLSEDKPKPGRKGFDLQQMWGLYADNGHGVCLAFDKNELISALPSDCVHGEVNYEADATSSNITNIRSCGQIQSYIKCNAKALFFSKRKEWEHEQEYRIVRRFDDGEPEKRLSIDNSLKYVIIQSPRTIKPNDSILNSCEYICLRRILPQQVRLLAYEPFICEQSLTCFDDDKNGVVYWKSSE